MDSTQSAEMSSSAEAPVRRSFLAAALAVVIGGVVFLAPLVSGLIVLLDPLRRKPKPKLVRVTPLDALPDDGLPHTFQIVAERDDAWNQYPPEPVGAVYLIRQPGEKEVTAFTATCPHLGCFIGYTKGSTEFVCPCHSAKYLLDGKRVGGDASVAPRGMDTLPVEIKADKETPDVQEIYVQFERFQTGKHEKIPVA